MTNIRRFLVVCAVLPLAAFAGAASPSDASGAILAPPNTMIHGGPSGTTSSRTARFHLMSTKPGRIQCKLNRGAWRVCVRSSSGSVVFRSLRRGAHTLYARGIDRSGARDRTPAKRAWRVR
jgi:hypothetical protein